LFAAKFAASFGLKFGEKFSSFSLSTFAKKFSSWSVQKVCRKLPGEHRRVFLADMGHGIGNMGVRALSEGQRRVYYSRNSDPGPSANPDRESVLNWSSVLGSWYLVSGIWFLVSGSWFEARHF
jgi:hypothetical protein